MANFLPVWGQVLKIFLAEKGQKMRFRLQFQLFRQKNMNIILVFKKNTNFSAENGRKSSKIMIITLTGHTEYFIILSCRGASHFEVVDEGVEVEEGGAAEDDVGAKLLVQLESVR
jgi:hypothetical protein